LSTIRTIVIGVAVRDDRVLAIEGFDAHKGERFYRPPGGGIEFGETSELHCVGISRGSRRSRSS